jgi:hypothetical protein
MADLDVRPPAPGWKPWLAGLLLLALLAAAALWLLDGGAEVPAVQEHPGAPVS